MSEELWKRVGYIAGRLSETFPQHQVKTRSYETGGDMMTEFSVWDDIEARYIVAAPLTHAAIVDVIDADLLVMMIVRAAQRRP
jgi:hypothetical protein